MMSIPHLPDGVIVLNGTDVEQEWERFQPYEPLHHLQQICNPMSDAELDRVIDALAPGPGHRIVDIGCGPGELLLRIASRHDVSAVGVDRSPWMITRAYERSQDQSLPGRVEWWLGDGRDAAAGEEWDLATCLGASWVWHGFAGTARALRNRLRPGGRIAIGDLRLRHGADPALLPGSVLTRSDQIGALGRLGLTPLVELVSEDDSWRAYHQRVIANAELYAVGFEGDPLRDRRAMAREWMEDFERDRRVMVWSVWVAQIP
jgi:SAM-dependent methyltransferase